MSTWYPDATFPVTSWTLIHDARTRSDALGHLLELYMQPIYGFVSRHFHFHDSARIEDMTQGFIAQMIERELVHRVDRDRGTFRSLLCRSLTNYVIDQLRAEKRRDLDVVASPHALNGELAVLDEATRIFEAEVHARNLSLGIDELERMCKGGRLAKHWEVFELAIMQPALHNTERLCNAAIAAQVGVPAKGVSNMIQNVVRHLRDALRTVLADQCAPADVENEIDAIYRAFGIDPDGLDTRLRGK